MEALHVLAVTWGLRLGELMGLQWKDINFDTRTLQVKKCLSFTKDGSVFVPPKTAKGRRSISLPQIVIDALRRHKLMQDEQKGSWAMAYDLVFLNDVGEPRRSRNVVNGCFERIKRKGNLPNIRFHDLRHTCATLLFTKGVHPKIVQEMLGHSSIAFTLDTYSHVLPSMQSEAIRAMEDTFKGDG